jgi:hypothetical protein
MLCIQPYLRDVQRVGVVGARKVGAIQAAHQRPPAARHGPYMEGDIVFPTVHEEHEVCRQPLALKPFIWREHDSVAQLTSS